MLEILRDLLHVSRDAEAVFGRAQALAEDADLALVFGASEGDYRLASRQLARTIDRLGGEVAPPPEREGRFHRTWLDGRASLPARQVGPLLREVVASEHAAVKRYLAALDHSMPRDVRTLLSTQAAAASTNLRRYRSLLDS